MLQCIFLYYLLCAIPKWMDNINEVINKEKFDIFRDF